jgi:ABC-type polysaccharide/polyol phosphate transport system ATPase subunit
MRGLQMGMSFGEIRELMPSILDFSELHDSIEKPLSTYSTGMRLRLAVSISTMLAPDLLLLDEWIGTGDARFRERVRERMNMLVEGSRGLILATHNVVLMKSLCTKGIVLNEGKVAFAGDLEESLNYYNEEIVKAK